MAKGNAFMKSEVQPMLQWRLPDWMDSPVVSNRNRFAQAYAEKTVDEILQGYVGKSAKGMDNFFDEVFSAAGNINLNGVGLELGAGVSIFSTYIARRFPQTSSIYALEVVPKVVQLLQPRIIQALCPNDSERILPVVGSFDDVELPDSSVDFCFEYASLHHSDDLLVTLRETSRVLKPGAPLIMIDRIHHNGVTDEQREFMLDVQYSPEWLAANGYDSGPLNRRQNGEHEIRRADWVARLEQAGFKVEKEVQLREASWRHLYRSTMLSLPFRLRKVFNLLPSRVSPHPGELNWLVRHLMGSQDSKNSDFVAASSSFSVMVARKHK